jgi:RNA polymerase sigma factor (sigma-70 family)
MAADLEDEFDLQGCLASVRAKDEGAARRLVEYLYPTVLRIVRAHLPRSVAEEDLMQDVFLKMFSRLHQYGGQVPFPHWVSRIAVTTCIDSLRRQKRRPELRWSDLSEEQAEAMEAVLHDTGGGGVDHAYAARELIELLLAHLAPEDRLVLQLIDVEQKSVAEVRELTGWNSTLIKVRAFRARRKLRKVFENLEAKECP